MTQSRALWPFAALSAGYFAHIGFFNPYLPLWLKDMGFGLVAISLMTSMQSATRMFAPYLWGWLSDHTGQRVRWLRYTGTVAFAISFLLWVPWQGVGLFVTLFLLFTHTSGMMPLSETALAKVVSQQSGGFDARRYGRVRLWGSLGFLVTVLLAGAWFERQGMASFPLWSGVTLLAVVVSVWSMRDQPEPPVSAAHAQQVRLWPVLRQPAVVWFFVSTFCHVLAHIFIYIFFSLYLDELGYGKAHIGLLWAVAVIVEIGWFFTQGKWLARWSLPHWLLWAALAMLVRMVATASAAHWWWVLLLAQAVHAITFAAHHSACIALVMRFFPGRLQARGQALFSVIGYGASGVFGGLLGGAVSARWGLGSVFWLSAGAAGLAALAALMLLRALRRHPLDPASVQPVPRPRKLA